MAQPKSRQRVYAYVKPDRFVIENMEAASVWTGSDDVSGIATTTTHREGSVAITFDKDGTTEDFGMISKTLDSERQLNLVDYLRGKIRMWVSLSALTDVASVDLLLGESASHHYVYTAADADLAAGFNEITFDIDNPSGVVGGGAAWSSIGFVAVRVNLDAIDDTLTGIIVDAITIQNETELKEALYGKMEAKTFTITGAQSDYNVATQQSMFASPRSKVLIKSDIACTVELNASTGVGQIILAAGEQFTIEDYSVTNIFITTTANTVVRIVAFS